LPSRPTIFASSEMSPVATATSGTARTLASSEASTVGRLRDQSSEPILNAVLAVTTPSVPS
jgi:hypothetical protein